MCDIHYCSKPSPYNFQDQIMTAAQWNVLCPKDPRSFTGTDLLPYSQRDKMRRFLTVIFLSILLLLRLPGTIKIPTEGSSHSTRSSTWTRLCLQKLSPRKLQQPDLLWNWYSDLLYRSPDSNNQSCMFSCATWLLMNLKSCFCNLSSLCQMLQTPQRL